MSEGTELQKLVEKKNYWGFLAGFDAARFTAYVRAAAHGWTPEAEEALTCFMLGLPTGHYKFQVIAGPPTPEPRQISNDGPSAAHRRKLRARMKLAKSGRKAACLRWRKTWLGADENKAA